MVRLAIKHAGLSIMAAVCVRGIGFLLVPIFTRQLSTTDYGVVDMLAMVTAITGVTIALEIAQGLTRFLPERKEPEARQAMVSTGLMFTCAVNVAFVAITWPFADALGGLILKSADSGLFIRLCAVATAFQGVVVYWQSVLRGAVRPLHQALLSIAFGVLTAVGSVCGVVWWKWGPAGVLFGQICAGIGGTVLGFVWSRDLVRWTFAHSWFRRMVRFSYPLVPSSVAVWITLYVGRIALQRLASMSDVGIFGVASRFAAILGVIGIGLQASVTPLIYEHYRNPETAASLGRLFRYYTAASLSGVTLIGLLSGELVALMTAPPYYGAAALVAPLVIAALANQLLVFAPGLTIAGRTGVYGLLNIAVAVLNTGLAFAFVPRWGVGGAAAAACLAACIGLTAHLFASQREYPIALRLGRLVPGTLLCGSFLMLAPAPATNFVISRLLFKVLLATLPGALVLACEFLGERRMTRRSLTEPEHSRPRASVDV